MQCQREGLPLPQKIANAPGLHMGLELYYDAFWELNTCRRVAIPWSEIVRYANEYDLNEEQRIWLSYLVRELDQAYLKHHAPKKAKKKGFFSKWPRAER